jgi:hypothetical protein
LLNKNIADHSNTKDPTRRLKVAYVSPDLNGTHAGINYNLGEMLFCRVPWHFFMFYVVYCSYFPVYCSGTIFMGCFGFGQVQSRSDCVQQQRFFDKGKGEYESSGWQVCAGVCGCLRNPNTVCAGVCAGVSVHGMGVYFCMYARTLARVMLDIVHAHVCVHVRR